MLDELGIDDAGNHAVNLSIANDVSHCLYGEVRPVR